MRTDPWASTSQSLPILVGRFHPGFPAASPRAVAGGTHTPPAVATVGLITDAEALAIASRILEGTDPAGPDSPWLVATRTPDGRTAATASTMLVSGLFWAFRGEPGGPVIVGSDPRAVAEGRAFVRPCPEYVAAFALGTPAADATAYAGVCRIPAGQTARWEPGESQPRVSSWIADDLSAEPHLDGDNAVVEYVREFDAVVTDLAARAGTPLVSALSSGLHSSFMVASLVRSGHWPVTALTHSPLQAALSAYPVRSGVDEYPLATAMADAYPGQITHERVANDAGITPLMAAAAASALSGTPTWAPAQQVWINAFEARAGGLGAVAWFTAAHGSATFSFDHPYAAKYYANRGQWHRLARLGAGGEVSGYRRLRNRVVAPLLARWPAAPARRPWLPGAGDGLASADPRPSGADRQGYLHWLVRSNSAISAAENPAAGAGMLTVDPFCSRRMLRVAASLEPSAWQAGGMDRSFARRSGAGRVPEAIRLRRPRGQQDADAWFTIRDHRDEYLARAEAVNQAPGLGEIDAEALTQAVAAWPWGAIMGPDAAERHDVERLLALAEFAQGIDQEQ